MQAFSLLAEQEWSPKKHVEKVLGEIGGGDVTAACWEPGQISPNHCHPDCTEIYFCFSGGGKMRTPKETIDIVPGAFVVHPPGELHEYINGPARTLLFRVRYGKDMASRHFSWPSNPGLEAGAARRGVFRKTPAGLSCRPRRQRFRSKPRYGCAYSPTAINRPAAFGSATSISSVETIAPRSMRITTLS